MWYWKTEGSAKFTILCQKKQEQKEKRRERIRWLENSKNKK